MVTHLLLAQGSAKVTVASAPSNPSSQLRAIPAFLLFNSSVLDRSSVAKRSSSCSLLLLLAPGSRAPYLSSCCDEMVGTKKRSSKRLRGKIILYFFRCLRKFLKQK